MPEFSYKVTALGKEERPFIYLLEASRGKHMTISFVDSIIPSFKLRAYNHDDAFSIYAVNHFLEILAGTDSEAKVVSLIIEYDFSLTISIWARKDGSFSRDSNAEFCVANKNTNEMLHLDSAVFDTKGNALEHYLIGMYGTDDFVVFEYQPCEEKGFSEWPTKRAINFNKNDHPSIKITEFY